MNNNSVTDYLRDEYVLLQQIYEDFDKRILTIKSWTVTFGVGGIAVGYQASNFQTQIWVLTALACVLFWLVEGTWKRFQMAHAERIELIERYFHSHENRNDPPVPFQIYSSWKNTYSQGMKFHVTRFLRSMFLPSVFNPYLFLIIVCMIFVIQL